MLSRVVVLAWLTLLTGCATRSPSFSDYSYGIAESEWRLDSDSVTFPLGYTATDGLPDGYVVNLRLNGVDRVFMLDTGAAHSWLSSEQFREDRGILVFGSYLALGMGGSKARYQLARMERADLGFAVIPGWIVLRGRLPAVDGENRRWIGEGKPAIVGLIGMDFLHHFGAVIDLQSRTLTLRRPNKSSEPMPASARLPARGSDIMIGSARPAGVYSVVAGIGSS